MGIGVGTQSMLWASAISVTDDLEMFITRLDFNQFNVSSHLFSVFRGQ